MNKALKIIQARYSNKKTTYISPMYGEHPTKTGIGKKDTIFFEGCCNVLFDRKTIPKSGKSIKDSCFIKDKKIYHLIYDIDTRALLGLNINKLKEYQRRFDEIKRRSSNDKHRGV